jgi:sterol desaturase/sphingolipid hydroxylase (fatty acid hydroxylase superfamily)
LLERVDEIAREILTIPLQLLTTPSQRVYLPCLAGAFLLALLCLAYRDRSLRRALATIVSKRIWWHPSARMDYRLIVINGAIKILLFAPFALSALSVALATVNLLTNAFGDPQPTSLPKGAVVATYTLVLFVAWDLSRYVVHRLLHAVPALWEIHKVHHSAEVLTPFTVQRVHPLESFLFQLRGALTTGVVTGVFFYVFQGHAVQAEILGVNALGMLFNATIANLRHSHVWLSFGPGLERVFISPAQHQLHHSTAHTDHGKNYGSCLAIWDLVAGSLRLAGPPRELVIGVPAAENNHHPARAGSAIVGPLIAIARLVASRRAASPTREDHHESAPGYDVHARADRGVRR